MPKLEAERRHLLHHLPLTWTSLLVACVTFVAIALVAGMAHPHTKLFFNWEMSSNGGQTWTALASTPYASTDVTGLTALTTYSFRVSVTIAKVTQPWSQAVSVLVH